LELWAQLLIEEFKLFRADKINFENVQLETRSADGRERIILDDTENYKKISM